jgi:hypothetical protein
MLCINLFERCCMVGVDVEHCQQLLLLLLLRQCKQSCF